MTMTNPTDRLPVAPVNVGEYLDPVRYAEVQLTDEQSAALAEDVVTNLMAKVDAGARLFYAIYQHPKAKELLTGEFASLGFIKAYMSASDAFLPAARARVEDTGRGTD